MRKGTVRELAKAVGAVALDTRSAGVCEYGLLQGAYIAILPAQSTGHSGGGWMSRCRRGGTVASTWGTSFA